jgi:hypothetical protein
VGRTSNKAQRDQRARSSRERAAAARAAALRAEQRRRATSVLGMVVSVAIVGVLIVVVALHSTSSQPNDRMDASPAVLSAVTTASPASLQTVGEGAAALSVRPTRGDPPLTSNGKPEVLFIGAEFCPFCAAERWSLVQALSRFGTFSNLSEIRSASTDGNIATFSFYRSRYTSKYLSFASVEAEDRGRHALNSPTSAQERIWQKYDRGGFPFLDFGGKYYQINAGYNYADLSGLNQQQIAAQLKDPTSVVAQGILGEANNLTATLCTLTNNKPASACSPSTITTLQSRLAQLRPTGSD